MAVARISVFVLGHSQLFEEESSKKIEYTDSLKHRKQRGMPQLGENVCYRNDNCPEKLERRKLLEW